MLPTDSAHCTNTRTTTNTPRPHHTSPHTLSSKFEGKMSVSYDFTGRRAIVTGGARGIGRAVSQALAAAGCHVIATHSCAPSELQSFEQANIVTVQLDVRSERAVVERCLAEHLPVHYLVNNAGVAGTAPCLQHTAEQLNWMHSVNVQGCLTMAQVVALSMQQHGIKGAIVNVSSHAALQPLQDHVAYCASKAALDMITRSLALELGSNGIRVNSVNPTVVLTEMGRRAWCSEEAKPRADKLLAAMPLHRFVEVAEVVAAVQWLLSDAAAMTTGHRLPLDGGLSTC